MQLAWDRFQLAMAIKCENEQEFDELREILTNHLEVNIEIYEE